MVLAPVHPLRKQIAKVGGHFGIDRTGAFPAYFVLPVFSRWRGLERLDVLRVRLPGVEGASGLSRGSRVGAEEEKISRKT